MSYTIEHLDVFDCFEDKSRLDGTCYFEFHVGPRPTAHACWLDDSLFIRDSGFDFVAEIFYQTVPDFDYFSFVDIEPGAISPVIQRLRDFGRILGVKTDHETVFTYFSSLFGPEIWAGVPSSEIAPPLSRACHIIGSYLERGLENGEPVCILGM